MTIDEAIKRYVDNAEYERTHGNLQGCLEFNQLVKWLKELRAYRKTYHKEHVDDCLRAERKERMTSKEANARWICCPLCDKKKCEREADDCDVKRYLKDKSEKEEEE